MIETQGDELDIVHAAATDACVLLTGDPAASAPLAYQIHCLSARRDREFIVLDCGSPAAIVEERLETWVGAHANSCGDLATANMGTVLLKDVNRLQLPLQRKLANVLIRKFTRIGERGPRLIATTGECLTRRVSEGTFDGDLFYRLNMIHMVLAGSRRPRVNSTPYAVKARDRRAPAPACDNPPGDR
jgi:DNA-binding NtrC family response regulator